MTRSRQQQQQNPHNTHAHVDIYLYSQLTTIRLNGVVFTTTDFKQQINLTIRYHLIHCFENQNFSNTVISL